MAVLSLEPVVVATSQGSNDAPPRVFVASRQAPKIIAWHLRAYQSSIVISQMRAAAERSPGHCVSALLSQTPSATLTIRTPRHA